MVSAKGASIKGKRWGVKRVCEYSLVHEYKTCSFVVARSISGSDPGLWVGAMEREPKRHRRKLVKKGTRSHEREQGSV